MRPDREASSTLDSLRVPGLLRRHERFSQMLRACALQTLVMGPRKWGGTAIELFFAARFEIGSWRSQIHVNLPGASHADQRPVYMDLMPAGEITISGRVRHIQHDGKCRLLNG